MSNCVATVLFPLLFLGAPQQAQKETPKPQTPCERKCHRCQCSQRLIYNIMSLYGEGRFCEARQLGQDAQVRFPNNPTLRNAIRIVNNAPAHNDSIKPNTPTAKKAPNVIPKLVEIFNSLFKQENFRDANRVAEVAKVLYPDSHSANMMFEISRCAFNKKLWDNNKRNHVSPCLKIIPHTIFPESTRPNNETDQQIRQKMNAIVSLHFDNVPLRQALNDIARIANVNIIPDKAVLKEAGVDLQTKLSLRVEDIPIGAALGLLLDKVGLAWEIRGGVVSVTTPNIVNGRIVRKVYPVAELVIPLEAQLDRQKTRTFATREDALIKLITKIVSPASWAAKGGKGTIQYFPLGQSIVVEQSRGVQAEIEDLLRALRRFQDLNVVLETKIVTLTPETYASMQRRFNRSKLQTRVDKKKPVLILDDLETRRLLEFVQADAGTNIEQLPRATVFNQQTMQIDTTQRHAYVAKFEKIDSGSGLLLKPHQKFYKTGVAVSLRPSVSGDRRFVELTLNATYSRLQDYSLFPVKCTIKVDNPLGSKTKDLTLSTKNFTVYTAKPKVAKLKIARQLKIPHGKTALVFGGEFKTQEVRIFGESRSDGLPGEIGTLFKNSAYGTEKRILLLMVKPRLISDANWENDSAQKVQGLGEFNEGQFQPNEFLAAPPIRAKSKQPAAYPIPANTRNTRFEVEIDLDFNPQDFIHWFLPDGFHSGKTSPETPATNRRATSANRKITPPPAR